MPPWFIAEAMREMLRLMSVYIHAKEYESMYACTYRYIYIYTYLLEYMSYVYIDGMNVFV